MDFVLQLAALFVSIMAVLVAYFAMDKEKREELKNCIRKAFGTVGLSVARFVVTAMPFGIVAMSSREVWRFYFSTTAVTRPEIVMFALHAFNLIFYSAASLAVLALWVELIRNRLRGIPTASQNEKAQH